MILAKEIGIAILSLLIIVITVKPSGFLFCKWSPWICVIFFASFLLLLLDFPQRVIDYKARKIRFKDPIKLGVLKGFLTEHDQKVSQSEMEDEKKKIHECKIPIGSRDIGCSQYGPDEWAKKISKLEYKFDIGKIFWNEIDKHKWAVIINPFGEVYLEEDEKNKKTFDRITTFVNEGGIFVSVAGVPFWYIWDKHLKTSKEIVPDEYWPEKYFYSSTLVKKILRLKIKGIGSGQAPEEVLIYQQNKDKDLFDKLIIKNGANKGTEKIDDEPKLLSKKIKTRRWALEGSASILPGLRIEEKSNGKERYLLCVVKYGAGYFMFSFMDLDNETKFEALSRAICKFAKHVQSAK